MSSSCGCPKVAYPSRKVARRAARQARGNGRDDHRKGVRMTPYRCPQLDEVWHCGHEIAEQKAWMRSEDHLREMRAG